MQRYSLRVLRSWVIFGSEIRSNAVHKIVLGQTLVELSCLHGIYCICNPSILKWIRPVVKTARVRWTLHFAVLPSVHNFYSLSMLVCIYRP